LLFVCLIALIALIAFLIKNKINQFLLDNTNSFMDILFH